MNAEELWFVGMTALTCDVTGVSMSAGTEADVDCTEVAAGVTGV